MKPLLKKYIAIIVWSLCSSLVAGAILWMVMSLVLFLDGGVTMVVESWKEWKEPHLPLWLAVIAIVFGGIVGIDCGRWVLLATGLCSRDEMKKICGGDRGSCINYIRGEVAQI